MEAVPVPVTVVIVTRLKFHLGLCTHGSTRSGPVLVSCSTDTGSTLGHTERPPGFPISIPIVQKLLGKHLQYCFDDSAHRYNFFCKTMATSQT